MNLKEKALEEHKTGPFCMLPFSQVVIDAYGDCYPCEAVRGIGSFYMGNIKQNSIDEIFNSEKIKSIRLDMINGRRNSVCDHNCHNGRELTCKSLNHISRYPKVQDVLLNNVCLNTGKINSMPSIFLLKSTNICNLACRYCKKESSNLLADIEDQLENRQKKNNTLVGIGINEIKKIEERLEDVEEIILFGGEPTIYKPHYDLLERLIDLKLNDKIRITMSTNFMKLGLGDRNIFELINKFKDSIVWGSIDAYGDVNEYVRYKSNFKEIEYNFTYVKNNFKNIKLYLNSVISIINVFSIIKLHKEWVNKELISKNDIRYTILDSPEEYNILFLSDELKNKIVNEYIDYVKWLDENNTSMDVYPNNYLSSSEHLKRYLIDYLKNTNIDIQKFLKIRKEQIVKLQNFDNLFKVNNSNLNFLNEELNKKILFVNSRPISFIS